VRPRTSKGITDLLLLNLVRLSAACPFKKRNRPTEVTPDADPCYIRLPSNPQLSGKKATKTAARAKRLPAKPETRWFPKANDPLFLAEKKDRCTLGPRNGTKRRKQSTTAPNTRKTPRPEKKYKKQKQDGNTGTPGSVVYLIG
jgi:hypothetical protein